MTNTDHVTQTFRGQTQVGLRDQRPPQIAIGAPVFVSNILWPVPDNAHAGDRVMLLRHQGNVRLLGYISDIPECTVVTTEGTKVSRTISATTVIAELIADPPHGETLSFRIGWHHIP